MIEIKIIEFNAMENLLLQYVSSKKEDLLDFTWKFGPLPIGSLLTFLKNAPK